MVVEVGAAEEGVEAITNQGGVAPVVEATEEVDVVKTVRNIAELKTSEEQRKNALNIIMDLN